MKSEQFVLSKLDWIIEKFPSLKCSHQYDKESGVHVVEIVPSDIYHKSKEFKEAQMDVLSEFYDLYPEESMLFTAADELIVVNSPDNVKVGPAYSELFASSWMSFMLKRHNIGISGISASEISNYAIAA